MTKTKESFDKIVEIGDISKLFSFINDLSAEERQSLSSKAISWFKKASKGDVRARSNGTYGWEWSCGKEVLLTSVNAALALCSHEQLASVNWSMALRDTIDLQMLAIIKPVGMKQFGDILLDENVIFFSLVRDMMALDLCDKPTTERYYVGVIALPQLIYSYNPKYDTLKDLLLAERDILDDIWMLFEVEGNQEHSMSSVDKYSGPQANWDRALIELSEEGIVSRERLLDASLEALTRDFIQFRSSWFSRFHEALKPTLEERLARQEVYLHLLGSSIPPTVSFAVKALKQISSKTSIDKEALKKNIAPTLCAPTKSTPLAALSLIEKTLKENSDFRQDGCLLVAVALSSNTVDVQKKALTILRKYGDLSNSALLSRLEDFKSVVAASVLVELEEIIGNKDIVAPSTSRVEEIPQSVELVEYVFDSDSSKGYPLATSKRVQEIGYLDELLARAAYCLEHPTDVLEFDRVMDACSRLSVNWT